MKRSIFLLIFTLCAASYIVAQDIYEYEIKPDELFTKEVVLKGPYERDELKLEIKVKWHEIDNRIQLIFDRKKVNEHEGLLLFFPFFERKTGIKEIVDCKFRKKSLYTKSQSNELKYMNYFLESDNLKIADYKACYRSLANNNEEEFEFELKDAENEFKIILNGLYVARTSKKPWYFFSKRDKKLEFKVGPTTLLIKFPVKVKAAEVCEMREKVVPYVEAVQDLLKKEHEELMDAQKRQNCTLFGLLKDKIRRTYIDTNDKCERYKGCEEIATALKGLDKYYDSAMEATCKATVATTASCSLSESELSGINNRLRNLQMKVNVKKKDGLSTAEELKEFQSIMAAVNPKLTPECRKRYKNLIDAYTNYCTVIDSLFK